MYTRQLDEIKSNDIDEVGRKATSLGVLLQAGFPIPQGFVVTTKAYKNYNRTIFSKCFLDEICRNFESLKTTHVAVRSSAIIEDSPNASWAGQFESFLNINKEHLLNTIEKCLNSAHSVRAVNYAKLQNVPKFKLIIAVVIQEMVNSDISGVMFTVNPVTNNPNEIIIEAGYGLGELLLQGKITPDNYIVDKKLLNIKTKSLGFQKKLLTYQNGKNKKVAAPNSLREKPILSNKQIEELSDIAKKIEKYFGNPQDIEWAIEKGKIFIVQSRPITTLTV